MIEKLYSVVTNSDLTEGRGRQVTAAICSLKATAERLAKHAGVMGGPAEVREIKLFKYNDTYYVPKQNINIILPTKEDEQVELKRIAQEDVIAKALSFGLTKDEINLLQSKL